MVPAVLKLTIGGSAGSYRVSAEVGDKRGSDDLAPLPENLRGNLESLQEAILRTTESLRDRSRSRGRPMSPRSAPPGSPVVRGFNFSGGADCRGIKEIGQRLFDCVFQPEIYELYKDYFDAALLHNSELPIKLCVEAPELTYVPWEVMFDKRRYFHLCCSQNTPFTRVATVHELDLYIYDELPLRILGMVSAPSDFFGTPYELRTDVEQAALDLALEELIKANRVKLSWAPSGTRRELMTRIVKGDEGKKWDVFLFIGHGREGSVVFEEDGGSGHELVSADVLRGLLDAKYGPRLVILNSCKGAKKQEDRLASTAETLVRGGSIAAVVAMQFDISDDMGLAFSPSFFSNMLKLDVPIQMAMALTRIDLQGDGFTEWISPVLYMQNKNGRVMRQVVPPAA